MSLDARQLETLRIVAATHAEWLKDNRDVRDTKDGDDDRYPMYVMATAFMRLYYEAIRAGLIKVEDHKGVH